MNRELGKMKRQKNMFQMKKQDKTPEKLSKMKISNRLDKELKVMIIKMLTKLGRRMDEHNENFNRVRKYKEQPNKLRNTIIEVKITPEGIKSRLDNKEKWISDLEDRVVEITQAEQRKEERILKIDDSLRDL